MSVVVSDQAAKMSSALVERFRKVAGTPGVFVWRIEHFDLAEVPKDLYGSFFTGENNDMIAQLPRHA